MSTEAIFTTKRDMDAEKGPIVLPGDVVGTPGEGKKQEDFEEYLVKESFVPTHHHDQQQTKKMVVMRRRKAKAAKKEASLFSHLCAWIVEYQLGM